MFPGSNRYPKKKDSFKKSMENQVFNCFTPPRGIVKQDKTPEKLSTPNGKNHWKRQDRHFCFYQNQQTRIKLTFWEYNGEDSKAPSSPEKPKIQTVCFRDQKNPVIVTADSLKKVPAKRSLSQNAVMDNVSAAKRYQTFIAAIEELFDDHDFPEKLANRAEWLHLIAFTIAGGSNQEPQVKENLVVGSSVANINMRGYETYIKNWIKNSHAKELRIWASAEVYDVKNSERVAKSIQVHVEGLDKKGAVCFQTSVDFDALSSLSEERIYRHGFNTAGEVLLERANSSDDTPKLGS